MREKRGMGWEEKPFVLLFSGKIIEEINYHEGMLL